MVSSVLPCFNGDSLSLQMPAFTTSHIRELTDLMVAKSAEVSWPQMVKGFVADTTLFVASRYPPGDGLDVWYSG